jgi:putative PIN family toxin of toxin-antitoxin system
LIVVDTNVVVSGCRSRRGASFIVLRGMVAGEISFAASPTLIMEYEDVLTRPGSTGRPPALTPAQVDFVLDALCAQATPSLPWFRFRPFLADPKDDHLIECALAAGADTIVTNDRHFQHPSVAAFGLRAISAQAFLEQRYRTGV